MPRTLYNTITLALVILLTQCAPPCSAISGITGGCGFDAIERDSAPLPVTVNRQMSKKSHNAFQAHTMSAATQWAPLRISVHLQTLNESSTVCAKGKAPHNIINAFGDTIPCISEKDFGKYKTFDFLSILQAAVKLHTDRLLVEPTKWPIVVPNLKDLEVCKSFTIPKDHQITGVDKTDMILYAAPTPMKRAAPLDSKVCAINEKGRPTVGVVALDLLTFLDYGFHRASVRFLSHAIAHSLGFTYSFMKEEGMIKTKSIRGQHDALVMTSPTVKQAAQKHYGCSSLDGMEMKNKKGLESHWKRRNALHELMSLPLSKPDDSFLGLYTKLTLSAFQDLGYYKANFSMAEPMTWGKNAGCDFMTFVCKGSTENKFPAMFCDPNAGKDVYKCSSDRVSFGVCSAQLDKSRDVMWTEFCPITHAMTRCDKASKIDMPFLQIGPNSWCVDGKSLLVEINKGGSAGNIQNNKSLQVESIGGVCAEIECNDGEVELKYARAPDFVPCPQGKSIKVTSDAFKGGEIICPKYEEVCTVDPKGKRFIFKSLKRLMGEKTKAPNGSRRGAGTFVSLLLILLSVVAFTQF